MHLTNSNSNTLGFFFKSYTPQGWTKPRKMSVWKIVFLMDCDEPLCTSCPIMPIQQRGENEEGEGNYRAASLTLDPGTIMEQIFLKAHPGPWGIRWLVIVITIILAQSGLPSVMHPADNGRAVDAYPDLQQKDTYRVPHGLVLDTTVLSLTHLGGGIEHTKLCRWHRTMLVGDRNRTGTQNMGGEGSHSVRSWVTCWKFKFISPALKK